MAGLLKPDAARILVTELKNAVDLPVHLHTHDTAGNAVATLLEAARAGVDIVDGALSSMSGTTSQPSLNALVYALASGERATGIDPHGLQALADYWEVAREAYAPFECGLKAGSADVYEHEMPGGQYSNFRTQAISMGLGERWDEVKRAYRTVNDMLGDIVKVTPSSKAVGDMALFMVQNDLTPDDVIARGAELAFPDAFVDLLAGRMGQPDGGFPRALQKAVLKGEKPLKKRPGALLKAYDFEAARKAAGHRKFSDEDLVAQAMFPQVFRDYARFVERCGDVSVIDTPIFFYGLKPGEEGVVTIDEGKTLIVKLLAVGRAGTGRHAAGVLRTQRPPPRRADSGQVGRHQAPAARARRPGQRQPHRRAHGRQGGRPARAGGRGGGRRRATGDHRGHEDGQSGGGAARRPGQAPGGAGRRHGAGRRPAVRAGLSFAHMHGRMRSSGFSDGVDGCPVGRARYPHCH